MAKILECAKVDPSSGCQHVIRGETEVLLPTPPPSDDEVPVSVKLEPAKIGT